jgi:tetratricopeptide (TPR) repeat protein
MNTNYELAYLGIGKALNLRGEYKEAMKYFKLAHNATYYSKAYSNYRDGILNENFNLIMTCVVVIIGAYVLKKICNAINRKNEKYKLKGDK